jgi:hypothetical protein
MHPLPRAIIPPPPEVLIDNLPGRKVMGQQTPGTTTPEEIKDRIQDFTLRVFLGVPTRIGRGDQVLNQDPFSVAEIGRIGFTGFHAPMLPEVGAPRQPD